MLAYASLPWGTALGCWDPSLVLPAFEVSLSSSVKPFWKHSHRYGSAVSMTILNPV